MLLLRLLEELRDFFVEEVLRRLDPTARTMLARMGRPWLAAVLASGLPRAGKTAGVPLKLKEFCGSVELLAWAKDNGCPWKARTCALATAGGNLKVLQYAREHGCPWSKATCEYAARGGHLAVLVWAWERGCPWDPVTCAYRR